MGGRHQLRLPDRVVAFGEDITAYTLSALATRQAGQ
jgi:hypothetical protein